MQKQIIDFFPDVAADGIPGLAREVRDLYCIGAVAIGDAIVLDVTDTTHGLGRSFKESTIVADSEIFAGIAIEAQSAAGVVKVVTRGQAYASLETSVAAGAALGVHTVDGQLITAVIGTSHVVACALEAEGAVTAGFGRVCVTYSVCA